MPDSRRLIARLAILVLCLPACGDTSDDGGPPESVAPVVDPNSPTFHEDVAPIVYGSCAACHVEGGPGPFTLRSYRDYQKRASQIAQVVGTRFMPPWLPGPGGHPLRGGKRLTDDEIVLIQQWVKVGAPAGDPAAEPAIPAPGLDWPLGPPDVEAATAAPLEVPAEGLAIIHSLVFPLDLATDRGARAIEFMPDDPGALHGASFTFDASGYARRMDNLDSKTGFRAMGSVGFDVSGSFGGWAPGSGISILPPGFVRRVAARSDAVVELHLYPRGRPAPVGARVALWFDDSPWARPVTPLLMGTLCIDIPAGVADHEIVSEIEIPVAADLVEVYPHAAYVCRSMHIELVSADGVTETLITIPDWDFNWRQPYQFVDPVFVPAGARIRLRCIYDNTADNPNNPNVPPAHVKMGFGARAESSFALLSLAPRDPGDLPIIEQVHRDGFMTRIKDRDAWRKGR